MPDFGELINKAKKYATGHPDQVSKGIEKVEDLVDKQTGGQYHDQVENAGHAAANYLGTDDPDRPNEGGQPRREEQPRQEGQQGPGQYGPGQDGPGQPDQ